MEISVTVQLPLNVNAKSMHLFAPFRCYRYSTLKSDIYTDVFVAHSGLCLDENGLIEDCHHAYPNQIPDYLKDVSHYYFNTVDNPDNLISLEAKNTYLLIFHPWFNYYHWICESIFRLWMVRERITDFIIILPEKYRHADFINKSLEPFNIPNIYYIPDEKCLKVELLCIPKIKPICDSYDELLLKQVREFYINYVEKLETLKHKESTNIYISRKFAGRRNVINENELLNILESNGFIVFYPEEHTFFEQVYIFSKCKYVVGTHGSALTNIIFMSPNTSVLELHKAKTNELNHPSPLFWYMANALQINYYHQLCKTPSETEDYFTSDYWVDVKELDINLQKMISSQ